MRLEKGMDSGTTVVLLGQGLMIWTELELGPESWVGVSGVLRGGLAVKARISTNLWAMVLGFKVKSSLSE